MEEQRKGSTSAPDVAALSNVPVSEARLQNHTKPTDTVRGQHTLLISLHVVRMTIEITAL